MKRILLLLLCVVACFYLTACNTTDVPAKEVNTQITHEASNQTVFSLNETAVFDDLRFTANEIKVSHGEGFFVPESGNVFVGIKFTIENISSQDQAISSLLLFDGYADDIKCEYSLSATCAFSEGQLDGTIAPGKKMVGWYALEVPESWTRLELNVQSSWLTSKRAIFAFTK